MAKFQYKRPSEEALDKSASQRGGEFESFVKDEYRTYTPKKQNAIRILPRDMSEEGAKTYSDEIHVHYSIGPNKASVLCPAKMAGMPCPVCEERARAEKREDADTVKDLRAIRRDVAWVIDKKAEEAGPLLWAMPWTVDRDIAKVSKDPQTGGRYFIDDPDEGYDVFFDVDGEGMQKKYVGFQIARRPSSVDRKFLDFIANNLLSNVLVFRSYDEIKLLFEGAPPPVETRQAESQKQEQEKRPEPERAAEPEPQPETEQPVPDKPSPTPAKEPVREPEPVDKTAAPTTLSVSGASRAEALRQRFLNKSAA